MENFPWQLTDYGNFLGQSIAIGKKYYYMSRIVQAAVDMLKGDRGKGV